MDIFEEIENSGVDSKPKPGKKITAKKSLSGENSAKIVLKRDKDGLYTVLNPECAQINEEDAKRYLNCSYNYKRMSRDEEYLYTSNPFIEMEITSRSKKIARLILKAQKCSEEKKNKYKQMAIMLLQRPVYSYYIARAIIKEGYKDNLNIYDKIFDASPRIFSRAYQQSKNKPTEQEFDVILKYIEEFELVTTREINGHNMLRELSDRQFITVLEILRQKGSTIGPYNYIGLPVERVEKGLKMGVFFMNEAWKDGLMGTTYYNASNSYFCQFCDEMSRELVRYAMGEVGEQEQPQIQTPQFAEEKEKEEEWVMDKIYNQAVENFEELQK
ncbi:MAG: hypothetical protein IJA69_01610 [Clostridia bacterium]|nr:hypothetical protein [Clostridia bacterium]